MTNIAPNQRPQTAVTFIEGYPALAHIRDLLEGQWPGTDPIPISGDGTTNIETPRRGPLSRLGYRVGRSGASREERQEALQEVFKRSRDRLPGSYTESYL